MRIAYISAGAAGMLCGACLHDNTLAAALRLMGHDVVLVPTYTPIRTDETDVSLDTVFYGAVNLYLQQHSAFFRHTPPFLDRLLDHPRLLKWAARRGTASNAAGQMGPLTCSVLAGEEGLQRKELRRLVRWLRDSFKPDIVHLTNSMFLGLAGPIRKSLGVPVIGSVQGEELFFDGLPPEWRVRVMTLLSTAAGDADLIIAPGRDYAARMAMLMEYQLERFRVVPLGISLAGHAAGAAAVRRETSPGPFTIGYLARICPEKGFHLVVEAFRLLAARVPGASIRLVTAGYMAPRDQAYFDQAVGTLTRGGLDRQFTHLGEVDRHGKLAFLRDLDILCVAPTFEEPKGLYALEAMASGVPVLLPSHGAFPVMIEATGGGLLFPPGSAEGIATALESVMGDAGRLQALGASGRESVHRDFSDQVMAEHTLAVYLEALSIRAGAGGRSS